MLFSKQGGNFYVGILSLYQAYTSSSQLEIVHSLFNLKQYQPVNTYSIGLDDRQRWQTQTLTFLSPCKNNYSGVLTPETATDLGAY